MRFKDKVVLITGAGQGIGKTTALRFAKEGASVAVIDINLENADETAKELEAMGAKALGLMADVTRLKDAEDVAEKVVSRFGALHILVNNAGITRDALILRMKEEDWDIVMDVNLKGAFNFTKAAVRYMSKQRYGRIVNVASVVGVMGNAGQANYSASKAGLIGLTKTVAREFASRNVTSNAVAPGFIETAMTGALPEKVREELSAQIPLGRLGSAADVAAAILFLASDEAGYITGHVLNINGGMCM
ncbi:MAG: 3-oxoacyl-[acyl-carrier-protein] reductase [Deltaproteobacteria bacterium]|nr:3-oxoacyl-[acyl-carrier-protein] reductase [Deltaproteobacteria bacterium]